MRVSRVRRTLVYMLCVFLLGNAHICFADDLTIVEAYFSQAEGYSGVVSVPEKGEMRYYAQNDPLWMALCYEKEDTQTRRPFRDSGCCPTALAMAMANLLPEAELMRIADFGKRDYSLCTCSVNQSRCNHRHARYCLTSQRDFVRFLPLVIGDFAAGNNSFGVYSRSTAAGTGTGFIRRIAEVYGVKMQFTSSFDEATAAMKGGASVIALAGAGGAFTDVGHYVFLAHSDGERLYVLDPLRREVYKTNQAGRLEILQPGLVALRLDQIGAARFSNFIVFSL